MNNAEESPVVYVVHCVDTEGPLDENLEATFQRLEQIYGVTIEASLRNLELLQQKNFPGIEPVLADLIAKTFAPELMNFNRTWGDIDEMNAELFSARYRSRLKDDFGNGWKITWFCMDHIRLETNPRNKTLGFGKIHQYYSDLIAKHPDYGDELQFHYHPRSVGNNDIAPSTNYSFNRPEILESLARRLLDFEWFPTCYRPGFHSIRPDSHLFLEQWFPFDFSNQAIDDEEAQPDLSRGRFGDWRNAPRSWAGFQPSLTDYQSPGELKRTTFRCLNMGTRLRLLTENHVHEAFADALSHGGAVLAFTDHDFRDIRPDIDLLRTWISQASSSFPDVRIRFATAAEAARGLAGQKEAEPHLDVRLSDGLLEARFDRSEVFSHQPFLALRLTTGQVIHDNFDRGSEVGEFQYVFDELTVELDSVAEIGVAIAGNNGISNTTVLRLTD